ncbi:hypothetical protein NYF20_04025 [Lactobacillus delbrueckii]|uniref:hypothetical protein n=1 Tax=Lactobacillus delbrueckii TaxID=1584 RepID=UPI0039C25680
MSRIFSMKKSRAQKEKMYSKKGGENMGFPSHMTVSVSKGNKGEGSLAHTHRKEVLKKMTKEKQEAFLSKKGHTHIKQEYIDLNEDASRDILDIFNLPAMEESLIEYNSGKRKSRQIGKGEALTCEEKKKQLQAVENMQAYLRLPKKDQQAFLDGLSKEDRDACSVAYQTYGSTLRDLQKAKTKLEHTDTLGEAYYKKLVTQKGKKGKLYSEFVIQIGNAADYNEISDTGKIIKSYDRRDPQGVWQQAKNVYIDYLKSFNERNKHLMALGYSIHMDEEGAPHMHLDLVGIGFRDKSTARGKTRKNGPSIRIGFNSALEAQGFKVDHERPEEAFSAWQAQEQEALADSMKRVLGVERKLGKTNSFENIHEYKEYKAKEAELTKQVEEQEKKKAELTSSVKDLEAKQAAAQADLAKASQLLKKADDYVASERAQIEAEKKSLKADQKGLESQRDALERDKRAFKAKQEEEGDLDVRIQAKRKTLKDYTDKEKAHKKAIREKVQKEFEAEVQADRKAYLDQFNTAYRQELDREKEEFVKEKKAFRDQVKAFVTNFKKAYIQAGVQASADPSVANEWAEAYLKSKTRVDRDTAESHVFGRSHIARMKAFIKAAKKSLGGVQELEDLADSIDSDFTREKDRIKKLNSGSEKDEKDSHNKTRAKRAPQRQKSADYGPEL